MKAFTAVQHGQMERNDMKLMKRSEVIDGLVKDIVQSATTREDLAWWVRRSIERYSNEDLEDAYNTAIGLEEDEGIKVRDDV